MATKRFSKFLAVSLLALMGLTACNDEVYAKPSDYDSNIVNINDKEIYNNYMGIIYDAIRDGGTLASNVLDDILFKYAVSVLGDYNKIMNPDAENTLKSIAKLIEGHKTADGYDVNALKGTAANSFIKAHPAYFTTDGDGNHIDDDGNPLAEGADATNTEYARVVAKWNTIEKRIQEALYNKISGGSYSEDNIFDEKDFVTSLKNNLSKVKKDATNFYKGLILPEVEPNEVFTKEIDGNTILHRENYQTNGALNEVEDANAEVRYVEDELIPDIYRTLLVEQYLLDESYNSLGRSYARKVNVVAISESSTYSLGASYLVKNFVHNYIFGDDAVTLDDFKTLSNAWKGSFMSESSYATSPEYKLWDETGLTSTYLKTEGTDSYFLGTAYGDMIQKYAKINGNPHVSENESDFTGSGTYSKEHGKELKTNEIALKDYTTTGWFVKSNGVDALPSDISTRLFNISVSNALNAGKIENNEFVSTYKEYTYDASSNLWSANDGKEDNNNKYVAKINGKYYLRNATRRAGADVRDDIIFYDSGTYYIVQIEEAVSSSRLSKLNPSENYVGLKKMTAVAMEDIVNEVSRIIADTDTYRNLSKKHWLEEAGILYHDQVIYDYFKSNFPELFED